MSSRQNHAVFRRTSEVASITKKVEVEKESESATASQRHSNGLETFAESQSTRRTMLDTSTVRLVIFVGVVFAFAGDHMALIQSLWGGGSEERNQTDGLRRLPEGPPKDGLNLERMVFAASSKKSLEEDNDTLTRTERTRLQNRHSAITRRAKMMTTIKTACLPKLICELTSIAHQDQLSEMERSLLNLIRDTSLSTMAEVTSRYHFAAHMGQLISGIEGQGCHNFYPTCPLPGASVLSMMKKIRFK